MLSNGFNFAEMHTPTSKRVSLCSQGMEHEQISFTREAISTGPSANASLKQQIAGTVFLFSMCWPLPISDNE